MNNRDRKRRRGIRKTADKLVELVVDILAGPVTSDDLQALSRCAQIVFHQARRVRLNPDDYLPHLVAVHSTVRRKLKRLALRKLAGPPS